MFKTLHADKLVSDITSQVCNDFIFRTGTSPRNQINDRLAVSNFFNWAVRREYAAANPMDKIDRLEVDETEPQILSLADCRGLLISARDHKEGLLLPYVALGLFAGLRPAELSRPTWAKIDLAEGTVTIDGSMAKTRQRRIVKLSANAVAWLQDFALQKPPFTFSNFQRDFGRVKNGAGFNGKEGVKAKDGKPALRAWVPDYMRHTAISNHVSLLLDQQGDVRVFLEAVADAIEVEVQALFLQFLKAGEDGGTVEIGADADGQQIGLADAGGQDFGFLGAFATKTAKGIHEDGGGDAGGGSLEGLGGKLSGAALVNAAGAGVGSNKIVFKARLEVSLLADLLEKAEADVGVLERDITGAQHGAALASGVCSAQAGGEKSKCAAGALKVGDGGPALAHEVYEGRMEGVGGSNAVAEFDTFLLGLLLLCRGLGIGASHGRDDFLVAGRRRGGFGLSGHFAQQTAFDDAENFVAFDRLAALVFAGGKVVYGLKQVNVVEGLAFAGLE
jgi:hypothetical protein